MSFWTGKTVIILGGTGFLGKRLTTFLKETDARLVVPAGSSQLNLLNPDALKFFCVEYGLTPNIVFHLAARVGGIGATALYPVEFLYQNTLMGLNVVRECHELDVDKLIVAGSVCAYPERAPIPMSEHHLWDGYPEHTNAAYGLAKRTVLAAQMAYAEEYGFPSVHVLMANLYGPGQTFDPKVSHVIPAIINKIKVAKILNLDTINLWGTGEVSRDFLYVDDAARAYVALAEHYHEYKPFLPVNIGSGEEIMIGALAHLICKLMNFEGRILWDASKPNGQPRRCLRTWRVEDTTGWMPTTPLEDGLRATIDDYLASFF